MATMKVIGDAFTAFGTLLFGGYAIEMVLGGLPQNIRDYRNYKRKDSSSVLRKRSHEFEAENWEKNLCKNIHDIARIEELNLTTEKGIYNGDNNEFYDIFLDAVKLNITLPKIKIKKEKRKISKKDEELVKVEKPDKEKDKKKEEEIEEYVLYFESKKTNGKYEELEEKKVLTEKQFNNLKPLLLEEKGMWKLKHGGEKIGVVLNISVVDTQTFKMMLSTTESKYTNWVKDFHNFLFKENIQIFQNDLKIFEIDIQKISKKYFLKILCNLLGIATVIIAAVGFFASWWFWIPATIAGGIGFIMTRIK